MRSVSHTLSLLLILFQVFKFFKIVKHRHGIYMNDELETNHVFCNPRKLRELVNILKKSENGFDNLVVAGEDSNFTKKKKYIERIKHRFKNIL